MLALEVNNEELVKRLLLRGKDSGRADDQNEDIIRNRVNEYNNKTLPLKKYYSEQAKFHSINGIGTIEEIFNELVNRIVFVTAEIELTMLENDIEHLDMTINDFDVATEISKELQQDIEEVRKTTTKSVPAKKNNKAKAVKKVTKKASVKKVAAKKGSKKAAKPTKKVVVKKAKKVVTKKKATPKKKAAAKKVVKKALKKVTKKVATKKKVAPKKVVRKIAAKKKPTAKKVVKKAAKKITKKVVKKVAPKKPVKKVVAKKTNKKKKK